MSEWRQLLARLASNAEERFDELALRLRQRLSNANGDDSAQILPYLGYGTKSLLKLRGRVLEDYGVREPLDNDSTWRNLVNMYRRLNTRKIRDARVRLSIPTLPEVTAETQTDEEGYFEFQVPLSPALQPHGLWQEVALELIDHPDPASTRTSSRVMIPPENAQIGVISDLDDTVLQTDVPHLLKMARNTFLQNAHTRLPFAGVAEFYRALQHGTGTQAINPLFYVSNSIWNLYDLFVDFFELRSIPMGAFLLLDLELSEAYFNNLRLGTHKTETIHDLLALYPSLPFILIGDSGENDPNIYLKAALDFPGRVAAIYIRDVIGSAGDRSIEEMIRQASEVGTEMLLVADSLSAAEHAESRGYIKADSLPSVRRGMIQDNRPAQTDMLLDDQEAG
ncbi:MAG: DUF2183 domain-containing protein [Anaerolineae bacterium]|nr:DUF2183 domain-containing protein [Anaerolineae bacterium]